MPRVLDNWIEKYLKYTQNTEAPTNFHFWTALFTLAGAVERKVWIPMDKWDWVANLYVIFVAPPGVVNKSTTIGIGEELLAETKVRFGPETMTWQGLMDDFKSAQKPILPPGEDPMMGAHDVQAALTIFVSELGTFLNTDDKQLMAFLIRMWDGKRGAFKQTLRGIGEVEIVNPWLNLIGATTPTWFQDNFGTDMIGTGFASRMLLVHGSKKRQRVAYPGRSDKKPSPELKENLIKDLIHINGLIGEMTLTDEAYEWGEAWYDDLLDYIESNKEGTRKQDYLARKQTHLHKIAMLLSIARSDDLVITKKDLIKAKDILFLVERDMDRVLEKITNSQHQARNKQEVLAILGEKPVDKRDIYNRVHTYMSYRDFDNAVSDLIQARKIEQTSRAGKVYLSLETYPVKE